MTMIERVARAICQANQMDPDSKSHINGNAWHWEDYAKDARAAIEAMRDPTEAMKVACWPNHHPWGKNAPDPTERPEMVRQMDADVTADWQAMIDAALLETK